MDLHCYVPNLEESQGAIVPQSRGPVTKRVCVGVSTLVYRGAASRPSISIFAI